MSDEHFPSEAHFLHSDFKSIQLSENRKKRSVGICMPCATETATKIKCRRYFIPHRIDKSQRCVDFCVVNLCDVDNPIKSHQISTILFSKKITNLSILVGEARDLSDVSFILTR